MKCDKTWIKFKGGYIPAITVCNEDLNIKFNKTSEVAINPDLDLGGEDECFPAPPLPDCPVPPGDDVDPNDLPIDPIENDCDAPKKQGLIVINGTADFSDCDCYETSALDPMNVILFAGGLLLEFMGGKIRGAIGSKIANLKAANNDIVKRNIGLNKILKSSDRADKSCMRKIKAAMDEVEKYNDIFRNECEKVGLNPYQILHVIRIVWSKNRSGLGGVTPDDFPDEYNITDSACAIFNGIFARQEKVVDVSDNLAKKYKDAWKDVGIFCRGCIEANEKQQTSNLIKISLLQKQQNDLSTIPGLNALIMANLSKFVSGQTIVYPKVCTTIPPAGSSEWLESQNFYETATPELNRETCECDICPPGFSLGQGYGGNAGGGAGNPFCFSCGPESCGLVAQTAGAGACECEPGYELKPCISGCNIDGQLVKCGYSLPPDCLDTLTCFNSNFEWDDSLCDWICKEDNCSSNQIQNTGTCECIDCPSNLPIGDKASNTCVCNITPEDCLINEYFEETICACVPSPSPTPPSCPLETCEWVFENDSWRLGDPDGIGAQASCMSSPGCSCQEPNYTPGGFTVDYTYCGM